MPDVFAIVSRKALYLSVSTLVLSLLLLVGWMLSSRYREAAMRNRCDEAFYFLNARRRCEIDEPPKKQEYDELLDALTWRIDEWKKSGDATHVTIYFRDLENGPIFGINEQEHFAPASLLKVPIMIALLKYAELNPGILEQEVGIGETVPEGQNIFDPEQTLMPNTKYPVHEVLRRMIVYSDNSSKTVLYQLLETLSPNITEQTFLDLGISLRNPDGSPFLTVKAYASLFRALFNASYLNRDMSQKALGILAEIDFDGGITAGVPDGTLVAHKFGYLDPRPDERQLHDCGIVYHPKAPYLLCIMTRGKNPEVISSIIEKISKMVFDEVSLRDLD